MTYTRLKSRISCQRQCPQRWFRRRTREEYQAACRQNNQRCRDEQLPGGTARSCQWCGQCGKCLAIRRIGRESAQCSRILHERPKGDDGDSHFLWAFRETPMDCHEKVELFAAYRKSVEHLSAVLDQPTEPAKIWSGAYVQKIRSAREECNLSYARFQIHMSDHG